MLPLSNFHQTYCRHAIRARFDTYRDAVAVRTSLRMSRRLRYAQAGASPVEQEPGLQPAAAKRARRHNPPVPDALDFIPSLTEDLELQLSPDQLTQLYRGLVDRGYVSIKLPDTVQQLLEYSSGFKMAGDEPGVKQLAGKSYLEVKEGDNNTYRAQLVLTTLRSIALSVLHALCSAPDSPAQYQGFGDLLSSHPPSSLLHVNKYHKGPQASTCPCHDWHVDKGVLTVVLSKGPGLQVKRAGLDAVDVPHGSSNVVTVFPGLTLQTILNGAIKATEHRAAYTNTERLSVAFKLMAHPDAVLDRGPCCKPITVADVYAQLAGSIHAQPPAAAPLQAQPAAEAQAPAPAARQSAAAPEQAQPQPRGPARTVRTPQRQPDAWVFAADVMALMLKDQFGTEMLFILTKTTRMRQVFDAYCVRKDVDPESVKFTFDGTRFSGDETPALLGLENGDCIDVIAPQIGD